jgi:hypothetical protein
MPPNGRAQATAATKRVRAYEFFMESPPERLILSDLIFGAKILQDSKPVREGSNHENALLEDDEEGTETYAGCAFLV